MLKKNSKDRLKILSSIFLFAILFVKTATPVHAQTPTGITVFPSIVDIDLDHDEPELELVYKNNSSTIITLDFSAQDFTELEEGTKLKFLDGNDAANYKYSLSSWIKFEKNSATLAPQEDLKLKVSIDKDKLAPGAHYASIQASIAQQTDEKGKVDIRGILSSLVFVRTSTGNEVETAKIVDFKPTRNFLAFPGKFLLRLNNTGNVALVPHGLMQIYDFSNHEIARGILNEGSLKTLPETLRRYEVPLKRSQKILLPWVYKAKITLTYGKSEKQITKEEKFFSYGSFGPNIFVPIILILVALTLFLRKKRTKKEPAKKRESHEE